MNFKPNWLKIISSTILGFILLYIALTISNWYITCAEGNCEIMSFSVYLSNFSWFFLPFLVILIVITYILWSLIEKK